MFEEKVISSFKQNVMSDLASIIVDKFLEAEIILPEEFEALFFLPVNDQRFNKKN